MRRVSNSSGIARKKLGSFGDAPNRKGKGGSREMHFGRRHDDEFFRFVFPADFGFFEFDEDTSSFSDFTECTDDCTD